MSKRRLIIASTISILLVAVLLIGSTYSIFTTTEIDENANVYKTGNLDVTYTLSEKNILIDDIVPKTPEEGDDVFPYRITVTNNGTVPYMFDVILNNTTAGEAVDSQYIMTKVGRLDAKLLSECNDNIIKEDVILLAGESVDIDVRVWLDESISNSEIGKSFYAKLAVDGLAVYNDNDEINNENLSFPPVKKAYTVTLDNQGVTGGTSKIFATYDEGIYLDSDRTLLMGSDENSITVPTSNGYIFGGYYTEANGKGIQMIDANGYITSNFLSTNYYNDVTLYAKWSGITNTITFVANDSTYGTISATSITVESGTTFSTNGATITFSDNQTVTATPSAQTAQYTYSFNNWSSTSGTITGGLTITANFTRTPNTYTITLNNQSAASAGTTMIYNTYNTGVYLDSDKTLLMTSNANYITVPTKLGYTFDGYYTEVDGGGIQLINASGAITTEFTNALFLSDVTLYAKWSLSTYTVTYVTYEDYVIGKNSTLVHLNDRTFYKANDAGSFVGYIYSGSYTGPLLVGRTAESVAYRTSASDDTVWAAAGTIDYNGVTYYYSSSEYWMAGNVNDTSGLNRKKYTNSSTAEAARLLLQDNEEKLTVTYGSNYVLPSTDPVKNGCTFAGWYIEEMGNGTRVTSDTLMNATSNHTLYAKWLIYLDLNWYYDGVNSNPGDDAVAGLKLNGIDQGYIGDYWQFVSYGSTWEVYGLKLGNDNLAYSANGIVGGDATNEIIIPMNTVHIGVNNSSYGSLSSYILFVVQGTTYSTSGATLAFSDGRHIDASIIDAIGYTTSISGWSSSSGTVTSSTTITVNFIRNINKYNVTINSNNTNYGTVTISSVTVDYGTAYSASGATLAFSDGQTVTANLKTATGYTTTFSSWSPSSGTITGGLTITANFSRNSNIYTIKVYNNCPPTSPPTTSGTSDGTIYSKYGVGWFSNSAATTAITKLAVPSCTGYTFNGYKYTKTGDGSVVDVTDANGNITMVSTFFLSNNRPIYATWTPNVYTVRYNTSDLFHGKGIVPQITINKQNSQLSFAVSNDQEVTMIGTDAGDNYAYMPFRAYLEAGIEYTFNCQNHSGIWGAGQEVEAYLMLDGKTQYFIHMDQANKTFTPAQTGVYWLRLDVNVPNVAHTFSGISIYRIIETKNITYGTNYVLPSQNPQKNGYTFGGWYTEFNGDGMQKTTSSIMDNANNHTLYAKWSANIYRLTLYYGNCGTENNPGTTEIFVKYGQGIYSDLSATNSISQIVVPSRSGFTFTGYYYTDVANGTEKRVIGADGDLSFSNTSFTGNRTLYAKCTSNS